MSELIPSCSPKHNPKFLISYFTSSQFYVCENCINLGHWSRGIKKKTTIVELETGFERPSSSTMGVINND